MREEKDPKTHPDRGAQIQSQGTHTHSLTQAPDRDNFKHDEWSEKGETLPLILLLMMTTANYSYIIKLKSSHDREACLVGDNWFRWHRCWNFSLACMMWKAYEGLWQVNGLISSLPPHNILKIFSSPKTKCQKKRCPNTIRPAIRVRADRMRAWMWPECRLSAAVDTEKGSSQTDTWRTVRLPSGVVVGPRWRHSRYLCEWLSPARAQRRPHHVICQHTPFRWRGCTPFDVVVYMARGPFSPQRDQAPWFRVARGIPPLACSVMDSWARKCFKKGRGVLEWY